MIRLLGRRTQEPGGWHKCQPPDEGCFFIELEAKCLDSKKKFSLQTFELMVGLDALFVLGDWRTHQGGRP